MMIYRAFHYAVTGASGISYFSGAAEYCNITFYPLPSAPVFIKSGQFSWYSAFDSETTISTGVRREIKEADTQKTIAYLIYIQENQYRIFDGFDSVEVCIQQDKILFYTHQSLSAEIRSLTAPPEQFSQNWTDYTEKFRVLFHQPVSEEMKLLILSFPEIRFF